jgi:hypothetical protein
VTTDRTNLAGNRGCRQATDVSVRRLLGNPVAMTKEMARDQLRGMTRKVSGPWLLFLVPEITPMQRTSSALTLAALMIVVAGDCHRASAQGSAQEAGPTAVAPHDSAEPVFSVVSPLGDPVVERITMDPRLDTLAGKTIAMVWNQSFQADITLPAIEESLKQTYPDLEIIPYTEIDDAIRAARPGDDSAEAAALQAVLKAKGCDALISGNGG